MMTEGGVEGEVNPEASDLVILTSVEKEIVGSEKFVMIMTDKARKFTDWFDSTIGLSVQGDTYTEGVKNIGEDSKSVENMRKFLLLIGTYDIGLSAAGIACGIPPMKIAGLWFNTFLAPILEEYAYRTDLIPTMSNEILKPFGLNISRQKGRLVSNVLFSLGHLPKYDNVADKLIQGVVKVTKGGFFNKEAQEKGLGRSMYMHALYNAAIWGLLFIGEEGVDALSPNQIDLAGKLLLTTSVSVTIGMGALGVKEMMDDRKTKNMLDKLRATDRVSGDLGVGKIIDFAKTLMKAENLKGYKFKAGVELSYLIGLLEVKEYSDQPSFRDHQAKFFTLKTLEEVVGDDDEKSKFAMKYIENKLQRNKVT